MTDDDGWVDDMPVATRRHNWGWWGDPWPSGICYKQDPVTGTDVLPLQWDWEMQREFPLGEKCMWCHEEIVPGDSGSSMPQMKGGYDGIPATVEIGFQHKECGLRQVLGSYKHLTGNCPGDGSCHAEPDDGMTLRQDALAVWEWNRRHGR